MQAKIWNYSCWVEGVGECELAADLDEMVERAGFNVLGVLQYRFQPQGYTKIYLLAESHLALHTFPEGGRSYVELSSCNERMQLAFVELLERVYGDNIVSRR